jgi:SagB-type dehydrogenase family enzyme
MRERLKLRRVSNLLVYWRDGRLLFRDFANQVTAGRPITCEILDFFSKWRTPEAAVRRFRSYAPQTVRAGLAQLAKHGLLVRKGSPQARLDERIAREWSSWLPDGSFHFLTKDAVYLASKRALQRFTKNLRDRPQPNLFRSVRGRRVVLPARVFPDSEFMRVLLGRKTHRQFSKQSLTLEAVSQLLSLVWGVIGFLDTPDFGKLPHKTSPSGGARHPGEVYLMSLRLKGLPPGLYHYHPGYHRLETIRTGATADQAYRYCARQHFARNAAALFLMTAVFPRTMWKYRHPRAYRVVLLDTGHLCQTFCLVATWLGLAPFCTAALNDTLIEQDLGIDGVRESVLYVAGVGLPSRRRASIRYENEPEVTLALRTQQSARNADRRAESPSRDAA